MKLTVIVEGISLGDTMANMTKRINIIGQCRTKRLWTGSISAGSTIGEEGKALDGVKPETWSPSGSDRIERSFLVHEGENWRNIPAINFNILQAAENEPEEVLEILYDEAPDVEEKYNFESLEFGSRTWYITLVEALVYLSVDRADGYGERYWYRPWRKAKERNPDLLGEGRFVEHPGKDAEPEENDEPISGSAADANW